MTFKEKLNLFVPQAEKMPGVVVILEFPHFSPVYMTKNGLDFLGLELSQVCETGSKFTQKFFNREFFDDFKEKMTKMLLMQENENETFTFFHQMYNRQEDCVWFVGTVKIFHRNGNKQPSHMIITSVPIGDLERVPEKAERLLAQNLFSKEHRLQFETLSPRAKEILRLVALGKSSVEIAEELNISADTVNSHRRMVRQKLGASSNYDLLKYALSFDLI